MNKHVTGYRVAYFVFAFFISCFIVFSLHKGFQPIDIITIPVFAILLFLIIDFSAQYVYKKNLENFVTENFFNHRAAEISTADLYENYQNAPLEGRPPSGGGAPSDLDSPCYYTKNQTVEECKKFVDNKMCCPTHDQKNKIKAKYCTQKECNSWKKSKENSQKAFSQDGSLQEGFSQEGFSQEGSSQEESSQEESSQEGSSQEGYSQNTQIGQSPPCGDGFETCTTNGYCYNPTDDKMYSTYTLSEDAKPALFEDGIYYWLRENGRDNLKCNSPQEEENDGTNTPLVNRIDNANTTTSMMPSMEEMPTTTMMPSMEEMPTTSMMPSMEEMPTTTMMPSMEEMPTTTMMPSMGEMPNSIMSSVDDASTTTTMMPTTTMQPQMEEEMPLPPLMPEETDTTTSSGMGSSLGSISKSGHSSHSRTPSTHRKTKQTLSHQNKRPDINKHHMDEGQSGVINENTGSGNPININVSYNTNPSVKDMGSFTFDDGHQKKNTPTETSIENPTASIETTTQETLLSPVNNTTVNTALSNMNQRYYPAYLENPLNKNQHGTQIKSIFENQMEKNRDANRNDLIRKRKSHWTQSNYESTMINSILNQKCNPSPVLLNSVWSEWNPTD